MNDPALNPTKVATKWALFYVIAAIIFTYGIDLANLDPNSAVKYVSYLPFIGFCVMAQKEFKDQLGGYMTFGQGFSAGFRYAMFSGLLLAVFTYIYFKILNPAAFDKILEQQEAALIAQNKPQEQIDVAMKITKEWGSSITAIAVAISTLVFGVVVALIGAAVLKKERSPYDVVDTTTYNDPTA